MVFHVAGMMQKHMSNMHEAEHWIMGGHSKQSNQAMVLLVSPALLTLAS